MHLPEIELSNYKEQLKDVPESEKLFVFLIASTLAISGFKAMGVHESLVTFAAAESLEHDPEFFAAAIRITGTIKQGYYLTKKDH